MKVRLWALMNVPMIWRMKIAVEELSDQRCVVKLPFLRRNKNHMGSMYVGVLCGAADVAGGLMALRRAQTSGKKVVPSFKDLKADFHKRAEADTYLICEDGEAIGALVDQAIDTGERQNLTVKVRAMVPDKLGDEPAASFELTLSIKASN